MATKKKTPKKHIPRVILFSEGGVLHWACSDRKVQVMLVDKDVEGCDDNREITHPDGDSEECYVSLVSVDTSSKVTAHYWKQLETTESPVKE